MNNYIPQSIIEKVERLKEEAKYDEALEIINNFLIKDPNNEEALLQVADIQYRN
jgi:antitoxin component HigA of HigAB toxin-antitoxin module